MITRRSLGALAIGAGLPLPALAQGLSNRPIRLVIPFTPAGTTDLVGRLTAERLSARLGQQVVVDNRPGASGNVGGEFVARAEPDGHTILIAHIGPLAKAPALYPKLAYDPVKDF
jgi:tripartite-type tricarboxylate transporter receptor subunit TctC